MKIGMIGLKGHQSTVLRALPELDGVEITGIASDFQRGATAIKQQHPKAKNAELYGDWRHMLEHTMMDICIVCDENGKRVDQLIALAERNIHIVTEKPLTTTLADLDRLRKVMEKSKSRLTMLLTMRHVGKYATMRKLVRDGAIGEVRQASNQKSYRLRSRPEWQKSRERLGGTIPYIGIHSLDMMSWVTGLPYTHVAAFHSTGGRPEMKETEDTASILACMKGDIPATARLDYLRPNNAPSHGDDRTRIVGTKGVVEIAYPHEDVSLITEKHGAQRIKPEPTDNLFVNFVNAIRNDREPTVTQAECFRITEVVLKARQAADEKKLIAL